QGHVLARLNHPRAVSGVAWHPGGQLLATGCGDFRIYVWDLSSPGQPLRVLPGHQSEVTLVAFASGGDLLASNSWDGTTRLWDPLGGRELLTSPGQFLGFGPGDRQVAFCEARTIGLWELAAGHESRALHAYRQVYKGPYSADFSPDGTLLATSH